MKTLKLFSLVALFLCSCAPATHCTSKELGVSYTDETAQMSFKEFNGQYVFRLQLKKGESDIKYYASLGKGTIKVTYMYLNKKNLLFTIKGGQTLESSGGYVESGNVQIIIKSESSASDGHFVFSLGNK